jgi:hypothetical protein
MFRGWDRKRAARPIREIAWKAQLRFCARYRKLARSGKPATVVTAAIARELIGFVAGGKGWRRGCGKENPLMHYLPARRSDTGR